MFLENYNPNFSAKDFFQYAYKPNLLFLGYLYKIK